MGVETVWQYFNNNCYQLWLWFKYVTGAHPFLAVGFLVVGILAWVLYKTDVRYK